MPTPKNHATGLSDLLIPKNVESSEELQKKRKDDKAFIKK
jgi:hypothetical protein